MDLGQFLWPGGPTGGYLYQGNYLSSYDQQFQLRMQWPDGNLVLYDVNNNARWASWTQNMGPDYCVMQNDGNLVIYRLGDNAVLWSPYTQGNPGAFLRLQDDGNLVIYTADGSRALWWTGPL